MKQLQSVVCVAALIASAGVANAQCGSKSSGCTSEPGPGAAVTTAGYHQPGKTDAKAGPADIVDTAVAAGSFKTLAAALQAAGLVDALKGKGPFTVFAPTDEAFAKLPKGTLETLLKPENKEKLATILKYHVIAGNVLAKDVKTMSAETLAGQRIDIVAGKDGVTVDKAKVVKTDVTASNGVIHVIDTVILPPTK